MGKRVMRSELERRALDASMLRRQAEQALLLATARRSPSSGEVRDAEDEFIWAKLRERKAWRAVASNREE